MFIILTGYDETKASTYSSQYFYILQKEGKPAVKFTYDQFNNGEIILMYHHIQCIWDIFT